MTQIEQIKAEIERLKEIGCPLQKGSDYQHGYDEFYTQIKKFINSLPAEQTAERFGDEIDNFSCSDEFALAKRAGEEITVTAQHFAQWQKEQMLKSAVDATCVLLPPPDVFKVLICHEVTDNLTVGQKVKVIVKEDEQ